MTEREKVNRDLYDYYDSLGIYIETQTINGRIESARGGKPFWRCLITYNGNVYRSGHKNTRVDAELSAFHVADAIKSIMDF